MVTWDIQRGGRAWGDEALSRYQMTPEKTEMIGGRLYGTEQERLTMLALLLENVGVDKAVRLQTLCLRGLHRFGMQMRLPECRGWASSCVPVRRGLQLRPDLPCKGCQHANAQKSQGWNTPLEKS